MIFINIFNKYHSKAVHTTAILVIFLCLFLLFPIHSAQGSNLSAVVNTQLGFIPEEDVEIHPSKPIIYMLDLKGQKVHAFNYITRKISTVTLNINPIRMAIHNNKLYVTLSLMGEDPPRDARLNGQVAVIDLNTFTLQQKFFVDTDPYDIQIDNMGYMYISPRSDVVSTIKSYSTQTGLKAGESTTIYVRTKSIIEMHPDGDKIYVTDPSVNKGLGHQDYLASMYFNILSLDNGLMTLSYARPNKSKLVQDYFHSYSLLEEKRLSLSRITEISPDGDYLFSRTGEVMDARLNHVFSLPRQFTDIAFDPDNQRFFTSDVRVSGFWGVTVYAYKPADIDQKFTPKSFILLGKYYERIQNLFYQNENLIALTSKYQGATPVYSVSQVPLSTVQAQPVLGYGGSPEDSSSAIGLNFAPNASLLDPNLPVIYLTDPVRKRLVSVNYKTGTTESIRFDLPPEQLTYKDQKLYVTLLPKQFDGIKVHQDQETMLNGKIGVIDTINFTLIEERPLDMTPFDVVIDRDGYFLITPGINEGLNGSPNLSIFDPVTFARSDYDKDYIPWGQRKVALNSGINRVYTKDIYGLAYYDIVNGAIAKQKSVRDKVGVFEDLIISPDGEYLLKVPNQVYDRELNLIQTLPEYMFTDAAFDPQNNRVYTADITQRSITVHESQALRQGMFAGIGKIPARGSVFDLYYNDRELITLQMLEGKYFCEVIPITADGQLIPLHNIPQTLEVLESSIPNNAVEVPVNTKITFRLNQDWSEGNPIYYRIESDSTPYFTSEYKYDGNQYIIDIQNLSYNTEYTIELFGKKIEKPYRLRFKTAYQYTVLEGSDRYLTSLEISAQGWEQSDTVILATGMQFPDALSAGPLAQKYNAPILLTPRDMILPETEQEIQRLKAKQVIIIGGEGAISPFVADKLVSLGLECRRIAGDDRYHTALLIAKELDKNESAFIVTGMDFPDALSIASYAACKQIPIILTKPNQLLDSVKDYLNNHVNRTYIIGGTAVISEAVERELPNPERIAGNNRYETNLQIIAHFDFDLGKTYFATSQDFPDALSGAVLAAQTNSALILFSYEVSDDIRAAWVFNNLFIRHKTVLGGSDAVSPNEVSAFF